MMYIIFITYDSSSFIVLFFLNALQFILYDTTIRIAHQKSLPNMLPQLSQRLLTIANMVSQDAFVVDIGTDHGLLPIFLIRTGRVHEAYAVDKSPKALLRAKKNISRFLVTQNCSAIQSDGFVNLNYNKPATICLAGMGGYTMVSILERGLETKYKTCHPIHEVIMQPNKSALLVRRKMSQWNWFLTSETLIKERNSFYTTMKWSPKPIEGSKELTHKEMFLGSTFLTQEKSPTYIEWLRHEKTYLIAIQKRASIHFPSHHKQHLAWIEEELYQN